MEITMTKINGEKKNISPLVGKNLLSQSFRVQELSILMKKTVSRV